MQDGKSVAFLSQKLSPRAQQKSAYERELMAITMAVQKWKHYLLDRKFIIDTDQKKLEISGGSKDGKGGTTEGDSKASRV